MESRFGKYGGQYVPEAVMPALKEVEAAYEEAKSDREFQSELKRYYKNYAGRPTILYAAKNLTEHYGKGNIMLKREDLLHTGAHNLNNALGQALLARRMGKNIIIAETGAGQHGVAVATVAALFKMECIIFMGAEDIKRQKSNVAKMELLGAKVEPVSIGTGTLRDATIAAMRYWISHAVDVYWLIGTCIGPHPYPTMVRDFQSCISRELRAQCIKDYGRLPSHVIACVGGGSNAIGAFYEFLEDKNVQLIGVEAGGKSMYDNAKNLSGKGHHGTILGASSLLLQEPTGQVSPTTTIAAGLNIPWRSPELSQLRDSQRVKFTAVTDQMAKQMIRMCGRMEGIIPAIESAHALGYLEELMPTTREGDFVVVVISGRGEKDLELLETSSRRE